MNAVIRSGNVDPQSMACDMMQRVHNRDGLPEIFVGVNLLVFSAVNWFNGLMAISVERIVLVFGSAIAGLAMSFASGWALKGIRNRYLVARTGYVAVKTNRSKLTLVVGLALVLAVVAVVAMRFLVMGKVPFAVSDRWLLVVMGLGVGALQPIAGKLPRFYLTGALAAVAGIALAFSRLSLDFSIAIFFDFVGIVALITGGVALHRFLREPVDVGE
ncbi:MAG: hypothetical protein ABR987_15920 [Terracidiphilus sp.]|jgi:hypothetical protein